VNLAETFYSWVKELPVIDWHNHLDMAMLTADEPLGSLYSVWVAADPYKHRAMRICGEPERVITGDAPEAEKWEAWRRTLPKLVGNPLFDWAKAELGLISGLSPKLARPGAGTPGAKPASPHLQPSFLTAGGAKPAFLHPAAPFQPPAVQNQPICTCQPIFQPPTVRSVTLGGQKGRYLHVESHQG
jgi:hypothetical protein